jgi:hypothetical protein
MAPANDTWQTGNFIGAVGQSSFVAQAVNSTFDIAFVQHEPGSVCSTSIDCPFTQNLDDCLRYYTKSYMYGTLPGATGAGAGCATIPVFAASHAYGWVPYKKVMAKLPTVIGYSSVTGAANAVRDQNAGVDRATTGPIANSDAGFSGFTISTTNAANAYMQIHYTADTGW